MLNFLATARLLMDLRDKVPTTRYDFLEDGYVTIRIPVKDDVPDLFNSAAQMFEPID